MVILVFLEIGDRLAYFDYILGNHHDARVLTKVQVRQLLGLSHPDGRNISVSPSNFKTSFKVHTLEIIGVSILIFTQ